MEEKQSTESCEDCDFDERDRVKIVSPPEYANRHGYIVEEDKIKNNEGLMEVELDYILSDADGYNKFGTQRERLIIKDPSKQLKKYEYMKSNYQHFATDLRAESFLGVSGVATFILGFAISDLLGIDKESWFNEGLFYAYLISQSLTVGLGWFCVLILTFVGLKIKRTSAQNNISDNGAVHDDCISYYWYKSKHWKPWWMFGRDASPIEFSLKIKLFSLKRCLYYKLIIKQMDIASNRKNDACILWNVYIIDYILYC